MGAVYRRRPAAGHLGRQRGRGGHPLRACAAGRAARAAAAGACAVPAAGVVAEAMAALVLADVVLEKFGGDSVEETKRNYQNYLANLSVK